MKKLLAILMLAAAQAGATPYFRLIKPGNIQPSVGALYTVSDLKKTNTVTDIAIITHSTADGSLIPVAWQKWVAPEAWTPLQIGGGYGAGNAVLNFGCSTNVLPELSLLTVRLIDAIGSPVALAGLRDHLAGPAGHFAFSAGWTPFVDVLRDGQFIPFNQLRVTGRLYSGAAWKF
jgi:hypothetical protein